MPIVYVDVKSLEIHTAAFLSQDAVLMDELWKEFDLHTDNQKVFCLPERRHAKFFIFRILFGGTKFGFVSDPDFAECNLNANGWQAVIDRFYDKYKGIKIWHDKLFDSVSSTGKIFMPHGRIYSFELNAQYKWPETQIKNYPVQGLGADLMTVYRIIVAELLAETDYVYKFISSVHDSLLIDCPTVYAEPIHELMVKAATMVPDRFKSLFGITFNLPFRVEGGISKIIQ